MYYDIINTDYSLEVIGWELKEINENIMTNYKSWTNTLILLIGIYQMFNGHKKYISFYLLYTVFFFNISSSAVINYIKFLNYDAKEEADYILSFNNFFNDHQTIYFIIYCLTMIFITFSIFLIMVLLAGVFILISVNNFLFTPLPYETISFCNVILFIYSHGLYLLFIYSLIDYKNLILALNILSSALSVLLIWSVLDYFLGGILKSMQAVTAIKFIINPNEYLDGGYELLLAVGIYSLLVFCFMMVQKKFPDFSIKKLISQKRD